jgi:hypothetical protein
MTINETTSASSADSNTQTATAPAQATESTQPVQDANQISADTSAAGDTSAASPDAAPKSLLDVVKDVVDVSGAKEDDKDSLNLGKTDNSATDAKSIAANPVDDGVQLPQDEADDAKLPFHKHPRFQQVIQERSAFRREIDLLKPDADEWKAVKTYMDTNSLSADEVAEGFKIMAAMKSDPIRAKDMLSVYWNRLEDFTGGRLPDDLQQKVNDGEVSDDVASELARRRNEADFLRQQQAYSAMQAQEQFAMQQQATAQNVMRDVVVNWESGIKTRDADYAVKSPFIVDKVKSMMMVHQPRTPQEAIALVEQAYSEVNSSLRRITPSRQPAMTVKSETSSANVTPAPKSLQDAIRMAAAGQI